MNKVIGELLNDLRIKHGYTQQQLSDASCIPLGTVKSILSGATPNPGFANVCALLFAMDESADDFFCKLTDRIPAEKVPPMPELIPVPATDKPHPDEIRNVAVEAIHKVLNDNYITALSTERAWWRAAFFSATAVIVLLATLELILI